MNIRHIYMYMYTECMSPALNKSLAMQHTKCCNAVKIYNEIKLVAAASDRTDTHTHQELFKLYLDATEQLVEKVRHSVVVQLNTNDTTQVSIHQLHHDIAVCVCVCVCV